MKNTRMACKENRGGGYGWVAVSWPLHSLAPSSKLPLEVSQSVL